MNFKSMKDSLLKYSAMTDKLNSINQEIEDIKGRAEALREVKAVNIDGMPRGSGISDSTYEKVEKIVDQFDKDLDSLLDEISDIQCEQKRIGELLRTLNQDELEIITARYIDGNKWDYIPGILYTHTGLKVDRRQCFRIHDRAILKMLNAD